MSEASPQLVQAKHNQQLPHQFSNGYRHCTCEQLVQASKPGGRAGRNAVDFLMGYGSCVFRSSGTYLYFSYCLKYGCLSFSVAYITVMITFGLPTVVLLAALGQQSRFGPLRCWGFCPAIKGIGVGVMLMSALRIVPNMVVASESMYMAIVLKESFTAYGIGAANMTYCDSPLLSGFCANRVISNLSHRDCMDRELLIVMPEWGICGNLEPVRVLHTSQSTRYNHYLWKEVGIIDEIKAKENFAGPKLPTTDLLTGRMRRGFRVDSRLHGAVHWTLLTFVFTLAYCCLLLTLMLDDATLRTALNFLSLLSSACLVAVTIISLGMLSDGPSILAGLKQFASSPRNLHLLNNFSIWVDAVLLVLWNTGCGSGEIISLTKMNQFGQDFIRPAMLSLVIHCLANMLHVMALEVVLDYVGQRDKNFKTPLRLEAHGFANILMELQPYLLSFVNFSTSVAPIICFTVGEVCDIVAFLCCCVDSLVDVWPRLRAWSGFLYTLLFCLLISLCMPLCLQFGGSAIYNFLYAAFSWNCLVLLTVQLSALLGYLGPTGVPILFRHLGLIEQFNRLTFWWRLCWFFYTPLLLLLSLTMLAYDSVTFALGQVRTNRNMVMAGPLFNLSKDQLQRSLYSWWVIELLRATTLLPLALLVVRHGLSLRNEPKIDTAHRKSVVPSRCPDEDCWKDISAELLLLRKRKT